MFFSERINAKDMNDVGGKVLPGATTATADDYVSFYKFHVFKVLFRIYATMFDKFATPETTTCA